MKIILISPPSEKLLSKYDVSYSLGIGYLGSVLENSGHDVFVMDNYCIDWNTTLTQLRYLITEFLPDIICINCLTMNRVSVYKTISEIKQINPMIKIVVGGVHATCMYEQLLLNFPIDAICLNEGEATIVEMVRAFSGEMPLKDVKGIAFRDDCGKILRTEERGYIKDLNTIPFPKHEYFLDIISRTKKAFIMASRGCPFKCSFCSTSLHWGNIVRRRTPKNVVDEIEYLVNNFGVKHIQFMDDTFNLNNEWVVEICREILHRKIRCIFTCSGRVYPLSKEMIEWMEKVGFIGIGFGVESGAVDILKSMGKKFTKEQIKEATWLFLNSKIDASMYFIVGTPGETWATVDETIELIKEINKIRGKPLFLDSVNLMWIFPNTEVYRIAKERGFITDNFWLTDEKVKYFTVEHSIEKLELMAQKILWSNWLSMGYYYYFKNIFPKYLKLRLHNIKQVMLS